MKLSTIATSTLAAGAAFTHGAPLPVKNSLSSALGHEAPGVTISRSGAAPNNTLSDYHEKRVASYTGSGGSGVSSNDVAKLGKGIGGGIGALVGLGGLYYVFKRCTNGLKERCNISDEPSHPQPRRTTAESHGLEPISPPAQAHIR